MPLYPEPGYRKRIAYRLLRSNFAKLRSNVAEMRFMPEPKSFLCGQTLAETRPNCENC